MLKGLLGETPSSEGFIYTDTTEIAFVDQPPWIRNGTVQQNILGISLFEEAWYNQVVSACALLGDIAILPKGHATSVGSAGISLSGGQKQRLALARAVYSRKRLVILDDVFSGLDAESEEHICNSLLGKNGILRQTGATVLIATHAVQRLSYGDHVIALSSNGCIAEQGSYEELKIAGGYVQSLAAKSKAESVSSDEEISSVLVKPLLLSSEAEQIELTEDDLTRQTGDFAVYMYYFKATGWVNTIIFVGFCVLFGVSSKMSVCYSASACKLCEASMENFAYRVHLASEP